MPRATFLRDFDWRVPTGQKSYTIIAYKAGQSYLVKKQCLEDARAAGAVEEAEAKYLTPAGTPEASE